MFGAHGQGGPFTLPIVLRLLTVALQYSMVVTVTSRGVISKYPVLAGSNVPHSRGIISLGGFATCVGSTWVRCTLLSVGWM